MEEVILKSCDCGQQKSRKVKVYMTRKIFVNLLGRAFRAMKNGVYFIVIAVLVAELFKIMDYAN